MMDHPLALVAVGLVVVVASILLLRMHAFLALILGAVCVAALTPAAQVEAFERTERKKSEQAAAEVAKSSLGKRIGTEFGDTAGKIGILIALASIVGACLLDSGGADRVVRSLTRVLGEPRAPWVFLISGFLLAIPIFFDTVFLLLIPLAKALWTRTRKNYALYVMAIIAGGSMTHSLVPPTPGPLAVAAKMEIPIGTMILAGTLVSAFCGLAGYCYAVWADKRLNLALRDSAQVTVAELEELASRDDSKLPPLWLSVVPILLPLAMIATGAFMEQSCAGVPKAQLSAQDLKLLRYAKTLGDANVAMACAAVAGLLLLFSARKNLQKEPGKAIQGALADGGLILLITAAGGAFGGILQQTGIGAYIASSLKGNTAYILPAAFGVTLLIRVAQGSATVAMMTTVGMFAGFCQPETLGFHPVYVALAIGCGSKPLPWMNDSGFWTIGKMSGMTEKETLQTFTGLVTVMGFTGLAVLMILAKVYPAI